VLDDFEANLTTGGDDFLDDDVSAYLRFLTEHARCGRLLITSRYPVPRTEAWLRRIPIGPLTQAQTRKLVLRLPGLAGSNLDAIGNVLRVIGGHPRVLEFLDAVLRGGEARFPVVEEKLRREADKLKLDLSAPPDSIDEAMRSAMVVAAGDVLLEALLAIARREGIAEVLLQAAVSNLPVTPDGLAVMLPDNSADGAKPAGDDLHKLEFPPRFPGSGVFTFPDPRAFARLLAGESLLDVQSVRRAVGRLESLSLLHCFPDGAVFVHRWTAEILARLDGVAAHRARAFRAGYHRRWLFENESHAVEDMVEALRNFLAAREFDEAAEAAGACFQALHRSQGLTAIAALAAEILETLPEVHRGFVQVAVEEAQAHCLLGRSDRALQRYRQLLHRYEQLDGQNPRQSTRKEDHDDFRRNLSFLYQKAGDLYRALGQAGEADAAFQKSLAIKEQLANVPPQ
jgi:hypothetical protein